MRLQVHRKCTRRVSKPWMAQACSALHQLLKPQLQCTSLRTPGQPNAQPGSPRAMGTIGQPQALAGRPRWRVMDMQPRRQSLQLHCPRWRGLRKRLPFQAELMHKQLPRRAQATWTALQMRRNRRMASGRALQPGRASSRGLPVLLQQSLCCMKWTAMEVTRSQYPA